MKYRVIEIDCERIVITEDGGIACIAKAEPIEDGDGRIAKTEYYQERVTEEMLNDEDDDVYSQVGEGELYINDWTKEDCTGYEDPKLVTDALEWLSVGDTFEVDEAIFPTFKGM